MGLVKSVTAAIRSRKSAESEVVRLERAMTSWEDDAERTAAELVALEASVGALVQAEDPRAMAREMAGKAMELRFLIDGARAAAETSRRQLIEAREELSLAQAAEKRQQAARLTAEADAHQAKVEELVRQLAELDGVQYRPYEPSVEDRQQALQTGLSLSWDVSKSALLRDPIAPLLAEAEALEAPVLEERRAREAAARQLTPSARIDVPAWDDTTTDSQILCSVSTGTGSATFEVMVGGQKGGAWTVVLPDEQGRRQWSRRVHIGAGGGNAEARCNGQVLAKETRPGQLMTDGYARWWGQP